MYQVYTAVDTGERRSKGIRRQKAWNWIIKKEKPEIAAPFNAWNYVVSAYLKLALIEVRMFKWVHFHAYVRFAAFPYDNWILD